jgi:hypothetical protein
VILLNLRKLNLHTLPKVPDAPESKRGYMHDFETPEAPEEEEPLIDSAVLTEGELARMEREQEFDQRIKAMKDELASRTPDVPRRGSEAVQLHPDVRNLPHNIINDFYDDLPDVEISE